MSPENPERYETVLVLEDGAPGVGAVARRAAMLAAATGATLHVLGIVDPEDERRFFGPETVVELDEAEGRLEVDAAVLGRETGAVVRPVLRRGDPKTVVRDYLAAAAVDVIVVDQEVLADASRFQRWRLAEQLASLDSVDVLLVGTAEEEADEDDPDGQIA
ncbi:universal stress protein [Haloferacaceae archaeon DSL9]